MTYLGDIAADHPLASLHAASCTYRIAVGRALGRRCLACARWPAALRTLASRGYAPNSTVSPACCNALFGVLWIARATGRTWP